VRFAGRVAGSETALRASGNRAPPHGGGAEQWRSSLCERRRRRRIQSAMREQGTMWWARAVKLTDGPGVSAVNHCLEGIVVVP
jgi:hypothetical protein